MLIGFPHCLFQSVDNAARSHRYLFCGCALHGIASGLLQNGLLALAYDIPIPLGETELFNPDARTGGIFTGVARGWMLGPVVGGILAVMGGPFLALLLALLVLGGLGLVTIMYLPETSRRMAIPEASNFGINRCYVLWRVLVLYRF